MSEWFRNNFDGTGVVVSTILLVATIPLIAIGSYHLSMDSVHGEYYLGGVNNKVCQKVLHADDPCISFDGLSADEIVGQVIRLNQSRQNLPCQQ